MNSFNVTTRRHPRRRRRSSNSLPSDIEDIPLRPIPSTLGERSATIVSVEHAEQEDDSDDESPLVKIIQRKKRKAWAKLVAPVDEHDIKKQTESIVQRLGKLFSSIPSPLNPLLNSIEHRKGYTIRSYFQYIVWLFYLNLGTFVLCFTCIIMPTYIYPAQEDFYSYAINQYNSTNNMTTSGYCSLTDQQCALLNEPLYNRVNESVSTCLDDPFTVSGCCSLQSEAYFANSSRKAETDWTVRLSDVIEGTGALGLSRLFLGYYQNLTRPDRPPNTSHTYNMGLAVFLANLACLLVTGIAIVRKYGDGMRRSYVQTETFENNIFQFIFARWDYRTDRYSLARRHEHRFTTEITNVLLEGKTKQAFKFDRAREKILFQVKRLATWLVTLLMFAGAVAALYFVHRFSFQERAKKESNSGATGISRAQELGIEYLPSITVSLINLVSELIFAFMQDLNLYTRTTAVRHYLIRVILMRLILLFAFVFIVILQITCNGNQCGRQSNLIDCAEIPGQATFIHCWETLIGQVMYRLVITDTVVMLIVHLIVDPLRSLVICCCGSRSSVADEDDVDESASPPLACFLARPLEFEIVNYVLDLTYTQTLCWHGLMFCPFLPLIAAGKNIVTFAVKLISLNFLRRKSELALSPARARYIFTTVLLFSYVWALLPIIFFATSLRPSRGCGPFRLYSNEPDYFFYYSVRNLISQIPARVVSEIIFKLTSAVVIVPAVLILLLLSCILSIRRNSYRVASIELYKLLYSSHQTHQLAVHNTYTASFDF